MNANLANDIGNLLNRTLNLLHKFCGGQLPSDSAGVCVPWQGSELAARRACQYKPCVAKQSCSCQFCVHECTGLTSAASNLLAAQAATPEAAVAV